MIKKLIPTILTLILVLLPMMGVGASAPTARSMPNDMQLVNEFHLAKYDLTYQRYQQFYGPAKVLGGQLTQYLDRSGSSVALIGAHYADINPSNAVGFSRAAAQGIVDRQIGAAGERQVDLMINPANGRYFYWVETQRADSRWVFWIDADSGGVVNKYNALAHNCGTQSAPCGFGVAYDDGDSDDIKDLTGLTTYDGSAYLLENDRQETHDQGSTRKPFLGPVATDGDDSWTIPGDESPAQPALVDAHYYAAVTDQYFKDQHTFDWVARAAASNISKMVIHAHYSKDYSNAFWNGRYVAIGDGNQTSYRELTPLDVVAHEFTHGVTDFTSDLIYQNESGALNEAFSDMIGNSAEFFAEARGLEPGLTLEPDWQVGEDLDLRKDTVPGFRNMADPTEDGDPSHYADRYTGGDDNGGVHINSGIANHWYYLLVNGGQNADPDRASGTDVSGIGLAAAERIAFLGFTALESDADFCAARDGTISVADTHQANVQDAWDEVGVDDALCNSTSNSDPNADFSFSADGLTVSFTDLSDDPDGTIASWSWNFGDTGSSSAENPSHTYSAAGTYNVTLLVTDNIGATGSISKDVFVSDGTGINLVVTGHKVRGWQKAELSWSGASSASIEVYRDGVLLITTNENPYIDNIDQRGGGSYGYQVCEPTTGTCSNEVTITF
jgi:Zn-dependent metalloprotease